MIELVSGVEPARTIVLKLLESGKDVVTANKALLAEHGPELFAAAPGAGPLDRLRGGRGRRHPDHLRPRPSVFRPTPSSRSTRSSTARATSSSARWRSTDADYADALAEAQRRGYADAYPTIDVNGSDAAQKLAILAHLAFGAGSTGARSRGPGIDVVQVSRHPHGAASWATPSSCWPWPSWCPKGSNCTSRRRWCGEGTPLAEVRGAYNAIRLVGDAVGRVFFHGLGAGQMPTASSVVADLIDTIVGRYAITFRTLNLWPSEGEPPVPLRDPAQVPARFYLRFDVDDRPGVISDITGILGRHQNLDVLDHSARGRGRRRRGNVPLVIMTHKVPEGNMIAAMKTIGQLAAVHRGRVRMRVRD